MSGGPRPASADLCRERGRLEVGSGELDTCDFYYLGSALLGFPCGDSKSILAASLYQRGHMAFLWAGGKKTRRMFSCSRLVSTQEFSYSIPAVMDW